MLAAVALVVGVLALVGVLVLIAVLILVGVLVLVGILVGILVLVAVLVLVGILIGVLVLILVLAVVVHEDTSFSGCPFAGAVMMPAKRRDMRENYQKKMQKIVDRAKPLWYNTPENKEGRCIRPHLQQWQRG